MEGNASQGPCLAACCVRWSPSALNWLVGGWLCFVSGDSADEEKANQDEMKRLEAAVLTDVGGGTGGAILETLGEEDEEESDEDEDDDDDDGPPDLVHPPPPHTHCHIVTTITIVTTVTRCH